MARLARSSCPIILAIICFAPVLCREHQFGFRDAADFYYPLQLRVQQEWRAGRLPLWEPEENGGVPLLGNPSAAVLYPGKLIYAAFSYPWAARIYVIAHVALAFTAMWIMMHGWNVSPSGASLAALGYAFGGPVLLQYCNVIFLVGAAWMPLAFHHAHGWLNLGDRRALAWLAFVLSMQTLGGGPEAAYLSACAAAAYALGLSLTAQGHHRGRRLALAGLAVLIVYLGLLAWKLWGEELGRWMKIGWWPTAERLALTGWVVAALTFLVRWVRRDRTWGTDARLLGLGGACVLALAMSAIQLVPSLEFIALSPRAGSGQVPAAIYDFSIHPARMIEGLWPNVFGTIARGNHRWLEALPPTFDYQVWLESLYQGGSILILGLAAAGFRRGPSWRAWLTGAALIGLAAGLGTYGSPLFWARSLAPLASIVGQHATSAEGQGDSQALPGGFGGIYWLMATALPGFSSFRYPGKLLVIASLGTCGLAGLGWDEVCRTGSRQPGRLAIAGLATTVCSLVLLWIPMGRERFTHFLTLHPDLTTTVFGPLKVTGALADVSRSLVHAAVMMCACLLLFRWARRSPQFAGVAAVGLLTLDLALANAHLIHTVPQRVFDARPRALDVIERAETREPARGPYRIHRMPNWAPLVWLTQGAPDRIETIVRWERDNLRPKYAITEGGSYTLTKGTAELSDLLPFFDTLRIRLDAETSRNYGFPPGYQVLYYTRRGFDLWNTRYFILPARLALASRFRGVLSFLPRTTEIDPPPGAFDGPDGERLRNSWLRENDVHILRNEAAFPRAWIVHRARFPAPIAGRSPTDRLRVMDEILYQDDELWHVEGRKVHDPKALAWLEVDPAGRSNISRALSGAAPDPAESISIDRYEPQRIELTAQLQTPGLVILADVFYPGWELTIDGVATRVLRANRAMRGALVSAGTHLLVYSYRPRSLLVGAAVSGIGLVALMILLVPRASRHSSALGPRLPSKLVKAFAGFTIVWIDP